MNQGLYHPSFNANGAAKASDDKYWHDTTQTFTSQADCFNPAKLLAGSGSIASGKSGRPSGGNLYYDAIYSSGAGGVCRDMRYSAYGVDSVDFADADQRVKNGTYRGFEKLVFSKAIQGTSGGDSDVFGLYYHDNLPSNGAFNISIIGGKHTLPSLGDVQHIYEKSTGLMLSGVVSYADEATIICRRIGADVPIRKYSQYSSADFIWIKAVSQPMSVGGSFLQTDVIGNPANILATPQLANGWQGSWIPVIPDGTSKDFSYTRKALTTTVMRTESLNTGVSWTSGVPPINGVLNNYTYAFTANMVAIDQYQAFAKQTENAVNAVVYGGADGIGDVFATPTFKSSVMSETLVGKILKSNATNGEVSPVLSMQRFTLENPSTTSKVSRYGSLVSGAYASNAHTDLLLVTPNNNSPAFKALNYNANLNQQAFIQYAYTELKHNGTNWGDDGKVTIVDNQSTKTDLNGNTVLVGTAKLKEPIGWIKIKV